MMARLILMLVAVTLAGPTESSLGQGTTQTQPPRPPSSTPSPYAALDGRRQKLIDEWVVRFTEATGKGAAPNLFYDEVVSLSAKTTFEAVTHALMTSRLTDQSGASLGDALALVEQVETVKGEVTGAPGDQQFRMYVRLRPDAVGTLERSTEFSRGADNSVYHRGYPINYRQQGQVPAIQFSIAGDERRADIDVDYRSSSFPAGLFNGHLTASNSDVRAGDNYDRHINRWTGFSNWWQSFFGVGGQSAAEATSARTSLGLPKTPRAGNKRIEEMAHDFLNAWLVEGDIVTAMGYVSERAYACLAQDRPDPSDFDRGVAPFQIMMTLKTANDALVSHASLGDVTVGVRSTLTGLKVVNQPYDAQFVVHALPDDVAEQFDCESRLTPGDSRKARKGSGNYFVVAFSVGGRTDYTVALLWARDNGYWRVVSWRTGAEATDAPVPDRPTSATPPSIKGDPGLVQAARGFLDAWLIRKRYDDAFAYVSPKSYPCYDLLQADRRSGVAPTGDAGAGIRAALEQVGAQAGPRRTLDEVIARVQPVDPRTRLIDQPYSGTFTLASIPNAVAEAADCAVRARGGRAPKDVALEYGNGFVLSVRLRTKSGEPPVLRLLWAREGDAWRITAFDVEYP